MRDQAETTISCQSSIDLKANGRPSCFKSTAHEVIVVLLCSMGPALGNSNVGLSQLSLTYIGDSFGVTGGPLTWAVGAFTLANGAFVLFMGGIADAFGRKNALVLSYFFYALFSLASGFVHNFVGFCILRALQGVAGAASVPASVGVISLVYPPGTRRNKAMATFSGGAPVGYALGLIGAGISCEYLSWRSILYFMAIVYLLTAILSYLFIPADDSRSWESIKDSLRSMDYCGIFIIISGLTLVTFALTQSDAAPEKWRTPYIIGLLIAGILIIAIFLVYETYVPKRPLLPMFIWKSPSFGLCMAIVTSGWMSAIGIVVFYMALFFQNIWKKSPIEVTVHFLPLAIFGLSVNVLAAYVLHRVSGRLLMIIGMFSYTLAAVLWAVMKPEYSYWAIPFPAMLLNCMGADLAYNVGTMHTLNSVSKQLQSTAGGLFNTLLQLSITIGLAAASAIVSSITDTSTASPHELLKAYRGAFWLAAGIAGAGLFGSFFLSIGRQGAKKNKEGEHENGPLNESEKHIV